MAEQNGSLQILQDSLSGITEDRRLQLLLIAFCFGAFFEGAANSSGGVMGKMIDAHAIVVARTAIRWFNHEGDILRYVFSHSIALACLVGLYLTMQACVWPFTLMVVK